MKTFKPHKKTYEDFFSTDLPKSHSKFKLEKVGATSMEVDKYIPLFRNFLTTFYIELFNSSVRLCWLRRQFTYHGHRTRYPMDANSPLINIGFVKFLRRIIGKDIQIITKSKVFSKLETYFDVFFHGFDEGNPFENPDYYKFPFQNISIDYLIVVCQLDDRIQLLNIAEREKMSYAIFVDYIINHVYNENEVIGRERYKVNFSMGTRFPFYIKDTDKHMEFKNKKKK